MTKQFIHIDSNFRDRAMYPNPANFIVKYGSPIGNNLFTMTNPVTNQLPIYNFVFPYCSLSRSTQFFGPSIPIVENSSVIIRIDSCNSKSVILNKEDMDIFLGDLSKVSNYNVENILKNLYFIYGDNTTPGFAYNISRIVNYDNLLYTITLKDAISNFDLSVINYGYIYNSSYETDTSTFILLMGDVFYNGYLEKQNLCYLFNATQNEFITVNFNIDQTMLRSDEKFSNWSINDFYMLYNFKPQTYCKLVKFPISDMIAKFTEGKEKNKGVFEYFTERKC
jgi:hypothetical protein